MANIPDLSPEAARMLKVILDHSIVGGSELMRYTGSKDSAEMLKWVHELQEKNLIETSGDTSNPHTLPFATFGTRPSAKEYLHFVLKQKLA